MFKFIRNLFKRNSVDLKGLVAKGAIIVDVRTPNEFTSGNFKGSINIPLPVLKKKTGDLKRADKPVITVCASGARSATAKSILIAHGIQAHNGGSWRSLYRKL